MNFLAHIYLSGADEGVIMGNFMADAIKGNKYKGYEESVIRGIILHRMIDTYTDQHLIVSQSKQRLYAKYHHYAPVVVDVFYDHFLAKNWTSYSTEPLLEYTERFYALVAQHNSLFPEKIRQLLKYMTKENRLYAYRETAGIAKALSGMARRAKYPSGMETAVDDLITHYAAFEADFNQFFPQLQEMANAYLTGVVVE